MKYEIEFRDGELRVWSLGTLITYLSTPPDKSREENIEEALSDVVRIEEMQYFKKD